MNDSLQWICDVDLPVGESMYCLWLVLTIGGFLSGPDPNGDYYVNENLGTMYTQPFSFKNPTAPIAGNKKFKTITLNYSATPIRYF